MPVHPPRKKNSRMKITNVSLGLFSCVLLLMVSCKKTDSLEGTWEYQGGIYNGKKEGAPTDYKMQRSYQDETYEGFVLEEDAEPEKYDGGNYEIRDSIYLETTTFSSQPSQVLNKTITYKFKREGELFTIMGTLPNGMQIEEYWKKIK